MAVHRVGSPSLDSSRRRDQLAHKSRAGGQREARVQPGRARAGDRDLGRFALHEHSSSRILAIRAAPLGRATDLQPKSAVIATRRAQNSRWKHSGSSADDGVNV